MNLNNSEIDILKVNTLALVFGSQIETGKLVIWKPNKLEKNGLIFWELNKLENHESIFLSVNKVEKQ